MGPIKENVFAYIREAYGREPEYLWDRFPDYAVFRHGDNRKWFAVEMNVPRVKLGLDGDGKIDILNVKVGDPLLVDLLIGQPGYLRAYHMSKGAWVSILLDGTVPEDEICGRIDESFSVTGAKRRN